MNNVVCVWAGDTYSEQYVKRLADFAHMHTTDSIKFVCFTDKPRSPIAGVEFRQMPIMNVEKLWWYKVYIFSEQSGLTGTCLYLDLDIVLLKTLDTLFEQPGDFIILQDFNRAHSKNYQTSNSSIIKWRHETARYIWDKFEPNLAQITKEHRGDQDYITKVVGSNKTWWPKRIACSFKWEWLQDPECMAPHVLVFHGKPKPEDFDFDLNKMFKDKHDRISKNKVLR